MTMDTRVHIADPVNPERLFLRLLDVLSSDPAFVPSWERPEDDGPWRVEPGPLRRGRATYKHTRKGEQVYQRGTGKPLWKQAESEYASTLGQGLGALLEVQYAEDGPLRWLDSEDDYDDFAASAGPLNEHLVSVSFDTAYGYRDANGATCADLQAFLLREIRDFLDTEPRPVKAVWHHEERGTWHLLDDLTERGNPDRPVLNASRGNGSEAAQR